MIRDNEKIKIVFIGGVKFSHEILSHIIEKGWIISALFTYEEYKKNLYSDFASFDVISKKSQILRHIKVNNINDEENLRVIKEINPDLILVMGWSQLLKNDIIDIPRLGVIGSHPTELPKYRGRSPIPWSIIKNLKESALTFFYIQNGVDNGDILDQKKFSINENDNATIIYNKIIQIGKELLEKNLLLIEENKSKRIKQDESQFIENWPKRNPEDGLIDWNNDSKSIHRLIRATTTPYPGAFTYLKGKKLTIWDADYNLKEDGEPGIILQMLPLVKVGTGNGILIIKHTSYGDEQISNIRNIFSINDIGEKLG